MSVSRWLIAWMFVGSIGGSACGPQPGDPAADGGSSGGPVATSGGDIPTTSAGPTGTDETSVGTGGPSTGETGSSSEAGSSGETGPVPLVCSTGQSRPGARGGESYQLIGPTRIDVPDNYNAVHIGDVTGDGRPDILGTELDHAALFVQDEFGSLAAPIEVPHAFKNPASAGLLHAGPDALLDYAVLGNNGLDLLPGLGDGAFAPVMSLANIHGRRLRVFDLDADGVDDLLWLQVQDNNIGLDLAFVHGDGAGSFGAPTVVEPGPFDLDGWIAIGDVTADGAPDLVLQEDWKCESLAVIPHDGMSGPSPDGWTTIPLPGGKGCSGYDVGDVDADGWIDVAWQDEGNSDYDVRTWLMLGGTDGFAAPIELSQHGWGGLVRIADVNLDGRNDVLALQSGGFDLTLVLSLPDGFAQAKVHAFPTAASVQDVLAVGDVDCDGCPDVVSADVGGLDIFYGRHCAA